jgi:hypothetical protein
MKKVTLYQVNKTDHMVTGNHLELRQYSYDQITPIRDSGEFVIPVGEVKSITLPIQRFVFCQKHWKTGRIDESVVYAAFDEELLKLIQCERSRFSELQKDLVELSGKIGTLQADNSYLEDRIVKANKVVDKVNQMGFWKRLVYLFKGKI